MGLRVGRTKSKLGFQFFLSQAVRKKDKGACGTHKMLVTAVHSGEESPQSRKSISLFLTSLQSWAEISSYWLEIAVLFIKQECL